MADHRSAQIEYSLDSQVRAGLDELGHQFAQQELLGEILRADAHRGRASRTFDRTGIRHDEIGRNSQ